MDAPPLMAQDPRAEALSKNEFFFALRRVSPGQTESRVPASLAARPPVFLFSPERLVFSAPDFSKCISPFAVNGRTPVSVF